MLEMNLSLSIMLQPFFFPHSRNIPEYHGYHDGTMFLTTLLIAHWHFQCVATLPTNPKVFLNCPSVTVSVPCAYHCTGSI